VECQEPLQVRLIKSGSKGVRDVYVTLSVCTGGQMGQGSTEWAEDYTFVYVVRNEDHQLGIGFFCT
jgi:hypothetical protein